MFDWRWALTSFLLVGALVVCACSSSSSGPLQLGSGCNTDPEGCPTGTTCWPADSAPNLKCLASDPGAGFGASCQQAIGKATCGDGLACDQTGPSNGSCTYYCGSNGHGCPPGYECRETHVGSAGGPTIDVCRPSGLVVDGGTVIDDGGNCPGCYDALFVLPDGGGSDGPVMR
jgi:hypothetical protein